MNSGYQVLITENGQTGLELFKQKSEGIQIVISDVIMPKMNGPTMIKKMREIKPDFGVILISGHIGDVLDKETMEDYHEILEKPFTIDKLLQSLNSVLSQIEEKK